MSEDSNRIAIILIEDKDGCILLGRRNDCYLFTNPGGHIKVDEEPIIGAIRELREETGLTPISVKFIETEFVPEKNIFLYLFKVDIGESPTPITEFDDPDKECDSWDFYDPNTIINELHVPVHDNILIKYWSKH